MENLFYINKVEVSSRHLMGETSSETPNSWANKTFTFDKINEIASMTLDMITGNYGKDFFQKLVVTLTYTPVGSETQHCIDCGLDEEGEIYCS